MDNEHTKINMFPFIITSLSVLGIITISSILAFFDNKIHPNRSNQPTSNDDHSSGTYPTCSYVNNGDMVMTTDGSIVAYDGTQSVQCLM